MEYLAGGELFERVVDEDFDLTESHCVLFVRQICQGVISHFVDNFPNKSVPARLNTCTTVTSSTWTSSQRI